MRSQFDDLINSIQAVANPLPEVSDPSFADAFEQFGDARVVLLGECTHGTSEFYSARAAISMRLCEQYGFRIIALEADWPDVADLDAYVRNHGVWGECNVFVNFPRWMWRNAEFSAFVRQLRSRNLHKGFEDRIELRGLDVYSLSSSIAHVLAYLDRVDPDAARTARRRYGCVTPFMDQPQKYGLAANLGVIDCAQEVAAQLRTIMSERLRYTLADGETYFNAEQNARVIKAAEHYYRMMYEGSVESWNARDMHMFTTLEYLLNRRGQEAKAIVWAHNTHIGDASSTSMGDRGEFNIGELCRAKFGDDCVAIGFGTDTGTVAAGVDWGEPVSIMRVGPAHDDSWEAKFRSAGHPRSLTSWRRRPELAKILSGRQSQRAIGVVYRPETERQSHYYESSLSRQYDAYVWFENSRAVRPLPAGAPEGALDIYPYGL